MFTAKPNEMKIDSIKNLYVGSRNIPTRELRGKNE